MTTPAVLQAAFWPTALRQSALWQPALWAAAALAATPAVGQTAQETHEIDIPAAPLVVSLDKLSAQTKLQMIHAPGDTGALLAPSLRGRMTIDEALDRLLAGTRLVWRRTRPGVVVIQRQPVSAALADEAFVVEEVVVTGSLLKGSRAGASPIVSFGRDDIDEAGRGSVAEALAALPQAYNGAATPTSTLAASDPGGSNGSLATGINLRGLGPDATLLLVNGRRLAGTGSRGDFSDASAVPTAAVARVDVLLDGASALYGSDAIAGVVNIILRTDFEGQETRLRLSGARGGAEGYSFAHTMGRLWGDGGGFLSYERREQSALSTLDRDYARSGDLRPWGGSDHRTYLAAPGNIVGVNAAGTDYASLWAIRPGADGQARGPQHFAAGALNPGFRFEGADLIPQEARDGLYAAVRQRVHPRLELSADARYALRDYAYRSFAAATVTPVTSANPWFVSPDGSTNHMVAYSFLRELGPQQTNGQARSLGLTVGAELELWRDWTVEAYGALAQEANRSALANTLHNGRIGEALGLRPDDPATAYIAARDGYLNLFGNGAGNTFAALDFISGGYIVTKDETETVTANVVAQGTLISLPGGPLKLAVGAQRRTEAIDRYSEQFLTTPAPVISRRPHYGRETIAAFAEARIPIIGAANSRWGVEELELSLAGRAEDYSDVGSTANPRIGLSWKPSPGLRLRSTWSTSFRAPAMLESFALYSITALEVTDADGSRRLALMEVGGNDDLKPETAESRTIGLDYQGRGALSGLALTATAFDIDFDNQIGRPGQDNASRILRDPSLAAFVSRVDPSHPGDRARIDGLLADPAYRFPGLYPASAFSVIVDGRWSNAAAVRVKGVDFLGRYDREAAWGGWGVEAAASYIADFDRRLTPDAAPQSLVGLINYPVRARGHLAGRMARGPWSGRLAVLRTDSYADGLGGRIAAWTTADAGLEWDGDLGGLSGLRLGLAVQNIFDRDPPFYDAPTGIGFDPGQGNALGRVVSLQLTRRW